MPKSSSRGVVVLSTLQLTACTWARAPHPSHPGKLQAASAKRVQASEKEREREKKNDYGRSLRQTTTPLFGNLPTNPPIKRRASESGVLRHHSRKEHIQPEITVFVPFALAFEPYLILMLFFLGACFISLFLGPTATPSGNGSDNRGRGGI